MEVIEKAVHAHFAVHQADAESGNDSTAQLPPNTNGTSHEPARDGPGYSRILEPPFAKVNSVLDGSPAAQAGLKAQDLIRNFGYVNRANHDNLKKVAECVQGNEGVSHLLRHRCHLSKILTAVNSKI
jgi:26S proteasome non-ATPase regulatory subunit 9